MFTLNTTLTVKVMNTVQAVHLQVHLKVGNTDRDLAMLILIPDTQLELMLLDGMKSKSSAPVLLMDSM